MSRSYKKPWVTSRNAYRHRINRKPTHSRRFRRYIRQDLKQWRNKYYLGGSIFPGCAWCERLDEYWDNAQEVLFWRACLSLELEPEYPLRHRWINKVNICGWRNYCDRPEYRRK